MQNPKALIPDGDEFKVLMVFDTLCAPDFADLLNWCVDQNLKIDRVEIPPNDFLWPDPKGDEVVLSNIRRNKAIFHLSHAPPVV